MTNNSFVEIRSQVLQLVCEMALQKYRMDGNTRYENACADFRAARPHGMPDFAPAKQIARLDVLIALSELNDTVLVGAEDIFMLICFEDCKELLITGDTNV